METRTVLLLCLLLTLMTFTECSSRAKRDNQPPTESDQQTVEKGYQQSLDKLRELTGGTKETLDGKTPPQSKARKQPTPKR